MNEALDNVSQIPFDIFYDKYLEMGGTDFWKTRGNAVWWSLTEKQREQAFVELCKTGTNEMIYEYLKKYYERY